MSDVRTCPECSCQHKGGGRRCACGYLFTPRPAGEQPPDEKPKPKLWLAVLPGVLTVALTAGFAVPKWLEMSRVTGVITSGAKAGSSQNLSKCVDVYSVTLKTSEFYVPENRIQPRKNAPRELSTVVTGMASNRCGEPLQSVRIRINVRDDRGGRGSAWAKVGDLGVGQAKPFERAWMARITSYEIGEVR